MKPDVEFSVLHILGESLERLWKPGMEAIKLRLEHNIQAVEDFPVAAQRAGCQISYVDLPIKVSGFAQVIEDTPHIVVNRTKRSSHTTFTVAHELAHHNIVAAKQTNAAEAMRTNRVLFISSS